MSQHAQAIVFDAPQQLSVQTLEIKVFEANDIEVDVTFSGISTGTERLLWDGSMPPFPGLGIRWCLATKPSASLARSVKVHPCKSATMCSCPALTPFKV